MGAQPHSEGANALPREKEPGCSRFFVGHGKKEVALELYRPLATPRASAGGLSVTSVRLTRRATLAGLACATVQTARGWAAADVPLRARVHLAGTTFDYDAADGEDLGNFLSPAGFVQGCIRVTRPDCPLVLFFRPDRTQARLEVVVELGRIWDSTPSNVGPYRLEVQGPSGRAGAVDVPKHYWWSRWRWQSEPRPVVANLERLIADALLPPYARNGTLSFAKVRAPEERSTPYRIMELAGVEPRMGTTGERSDIGLVTEHQARFICTGSRGALDIARHQAEAAGTLPWHMRDERTGAPVDLDRYERMSWYGNPTAGRPHVPRTSTGITIDSAHQPALSYVPYLLTGDPYHLEDLQFAANYNRGSLPPDYRLSIPQTRAFAWSLRTLAQAARVTPADVPSWLLPAAYFKRDLDRTRDWFAKTYVSSAKPEHAIFRVTDEIGSSRDEAPRAPGGTWVAPWQDEFLVSVMAWTVMMGFRDWTPALRWKVNGTLARASGESGWARAYVTPYRLVLRPSKREPIVSSWREAWDLNSRLAGLPATSGDVLKDDDPTRAVFTRGALLLAARAGIEDARAPLAWITDAIRRSGAAIPYKWLLV